MGSGASRSNAVAAVGSNARRVFLGGACGRSEWRKREAIPLFEQAGIPTVNPQVDDWTPDLLAEEELAKNDPACTLLWVINDETRGTGAMIEAIHFAHQFPSRLVLVIEKPYGNSLGDAVDVAEDIRRGRVILENLTRDALGVRVFASVELAVQHIVSSW